jgi:hypothetical protein
VTVAIRVDNYRTGEKGRVGVRWESGPAIKVGSRVTWVRTDSGKKK